MPSVKGMLQHGVLLKKSVFPNATCTYSTSGEASYQEVFGDLILVLLHHPLTVDCVYPSSQDGPGRRLRIEIQPQDSHDSSPDGSASSVADTGLLSIPLGRLAGLTSVSPQHTLRIAHSQCIYDDYRVKFVYIRLPTENDLEEFRLGFEEMVRLRDCQEDRLEPLFQNLIDESRRESRKQFRTPKSREPIRRSRVDRSVDTIDPLLLPPPFQEDETEVKLEEKLLVTASLFRYQKDTTEPGVGYAPSGSPCDRYSLERVLGAPITLPVDSPKVHADFLSAVSDSAGGASSASVIAVPAIAAPVAIPVPPPPITPAATVSVAAEQAKKSTTCAPKQIDVQLKQQPAEKSVRVEAVVAGPVASGVKLSGAKSPARVAIQRIRPVSPLPRTLPEDEVLRELRVRSRGSWKKIAANVSVRVFPFAGRAMITVVNDSLGHYIYTTWVHSRMVCTQMGSSGYPDLFFPAPIRSSYKSDSSDEAGEWALVGLRFATGKDAQLFIDHINRHRSRLLLRETVHRMDLPVPSR